MEWTTVYLHTSCTTFYCGRESKDKIVLNLQYYSYIIPVSHEAKTELHLIIILKIMQMSNVNMLDSDFWKSDSFENTSEL
jgi:hypothetical protein